MGQRENVSRHRIHPSAATVVQRRHDRVLEKTCYPIAADGVVNSVGSDVLSAIGGGGLLSVHESGRCRSCWGSG